MKRSDPLLDLDGPEYEKPEMNEPSPEDISFLSDANIEWCCELYFAELVKRDIRRAASFRHRLLDYFGEERQQAERLPVANRQSA